MSNQQTYPYTAPFPFKMGPIQKIIHENQEITPETLQEIFKPPKPEKPLKPFTIKFQNGSKLILNINNAKALPQQNGQKIIELELNPIKNPIDDYYQYKYQDNQ